MFYSGIDQHKRDSFITTYDAGGAIVNQERVPNTPLHIQRYFAQFPGPHKAVVESTGSWYWLADLLQHLNVELSLAHATRLKAISAAKVKTDKVDSDILALLLRADLIPEAHMICPEQRAPRDLMRTRLRLVDKGASCKNSIARLLEKFNVPSVRELDDLYHLQAALDAEPRGGLRSCTMYELRAQETLRLPFGCRLALTTAPRERPRPGSVAQHPRPHPPAFPSHFRLVHKLNDRSGPRTDWHEHPSQRADDLDGEARLLPNLAHRCLLRRFTILHQPGWKATPSSMGGLIVTMSAP